MCAPARSATWHWRFTDWATRTACCRSSITRHAGRSASASLCRAMCSLAAL
uniref:Uncharacterized protein n=1 Tax=Siphoviridae sp. cttWj13 TaxID=2826494 RepID=A0A8S5QYR3_9CAUD|nr:MAG TPA: hypothetical protein [Siphoviridae sp. cttWj13]